MKTSNIILSAIVGSITLVIVTGFIQWRYTGEKKSHYAEQIYEDVALAQFKYLVIQRSTTLTIDHSDETRMVIQHAKNLARPTVQHRQRGDTLYIDQITCERGESCYVTIKTPMENIQWIRAKNSNVELSYPPAGNLEIELDHSRMHMFSNEIDMGTVRIKGINDSYIRALGITIDTLLLNLDHSEAQIPLKIHNLKGSIINHSSLFIKDVGTFAFRKDSTSRMF